jgi:RNA polymerase sigma factor (sigma-70 family)
MTRRERDDASGHPADADSSRDSTDSVTDTLLAERAQGGDGSALGQLIERMRDDVYRLALRMLWHPDDAADATQEILFKVVTSLATFRGEASIRTWILRVATNHLLNIRRSRVEEQSLTFETFAIDLADGMDQSIDPSAPRRDEADQALLEQEVKIGCTQAMLLCLGRDERIAYILGDVFELRSDEASDVVGIDSATYRKRLSRARNRIRDFMTAYCGLVNTEALCSCARRVQPAIERGRVRPDHLLFAPDRPTPTRSLPVLEAVGAMERLHDIAAVYQSHPRFNAPGRVTEAIRDALRSAGIELLLAD